MSHLLRSTPDTWTATVRHLRGAPERVMFAVADSEHAFITAHLLIEDEDLEPGPWCVQLTEHAQTRVIQWAAEREGWLIEMHSHLGAFGDPAQLSPVDTSGLADWVPQVRWRLRQRPYGAVVFGPRTIDGVAWTGPKGGTPTPIVGWDIEGTTVETTGRSLSLFRGEPT